MKNLLVILFVAVLTIGCGREKENIDFGNKLIANITEYQKTNQELPLTGDWNQLESLGFNMTDLGTIPTYEKINSNEYTLTYLEGFDGPYLFYDSQAKKWSNGFPPFPEDKAEEIVLDSLTSWEIEVINFKYSINNLYGFWNHSDDPEGKKPTFEFDNDGFHLLEGPSKQYIINYDSIKISENHEGSFSIGQITKLTKDSLIIEWSTRDINHYVKNTTWTK